jgi:hypothetical protein
MLRLLLIVFTVVNVGIGLLLAWTRGAATNMIGVPSPLPFYANLLAIFLVASGLGFIPAIWNAKPYRFYLWVMGVGVKLVVASLFIRLALMRVVPPVALVAALTDGGLAVLLAIALVRGK